MMLADFWHIDPLPTLVDPYGTSAYWRALSVQTLSAKRDAMSPEQRDWDEHSTPPDVAADDFDGCPEDDEFVYSDIDLQNYLEDAMDRGEPGYRRD